MKGYIEYLHNIPDTGKKWLSWYGVKKRSAADYSTKIDNINELQKAILDDTNQQVYNYVTEYLDLNSNFENIIFSTRDKSYVDNVDFNHIQAIINFKPINEIQYVNEHFRSVNKLLPDAGIYIGRVETYGVRKNRFYNRFGKHIGRAFWLMDFIINRILPKIRPIGVVYKFFTHNRVHPRSKAEILGRLVYNGFSIIDYSNINSLLYFVVMKSKEPLCDPDPTYHAIVKLRRVGKGGNLINIFKFRTMHPYSEYLQDHVIKINGYNEVGKPADDFRVARWGKIMRKLWLDELPQVINLFRGEMKLFGVRPLSCVRFNEFPEDLKSERIKNKPGCFPPYVALCMPDNQGNIEAERIYLNDRKKDPYFTDLRYIMKAIFNILANKVRSS